jgi:hypothetical protein
MSEDTKKLSAWKKLALTSEETQNMEGERLEIYLNEQVTSEMPWLLAWMGRNKKWLLIGSGILIVFIGLIVGIIYLISFIDEPFWPWLAHSVAWLLELVFLRIVGWAWLVLPAFTGLTIYVAKKLIKRDLIALARYGTNNIKEYALASSEDGYVIGVSRQSFWGSLILGSAKAKIDANTWEYIQQNAKMISHKPLGQKEKDYRLLYVLPEEHSNEPILVRINKKLTLNPRALIRQKDATELILQNIDKPISEQIANNQILYNLTVLSHEQGESIRKLSVKVRSAPEAALQEYARAMMPETKELFFDTYKFLKDKEEKIAPYDSLEAEVEAMSQKTEVKTENK